MIDYCYDPETGLWAIMEDGYAVEYFSSKAAAKQHCNKLNEAVRQSCDDYKAICNRNW